MKSTVHAPLAAVLVAALAVAATAAGCRSQEEVHAMDTRPAPAESAADTNAAAKAKGADVSEAAPEAGAAEAEPGRPAKTAVATFAAGCFWGVEATFRRVPGVVDTMVGYTGGRTKNPTYKEVCSDTTGHAEAVQVTYDPAKVTYERLLEVFWNAHNPTTPNRQGPDVGSQYRSAIFFHTPEQEKAARASKERLAASGTYGDRPIVTEIVPAATFWRAEEYHQRYLEKHGRASCPTS
jgi:peptide-methionine (S)-S-oxide reductase